MKQNLLVRGLLGLVGWLLAGLVCQAQAPAWQMAIAVNNPGLAYNSVAHATATDAAGNVYIAGSFSHVATFGSTTLVSTTSPYDMFVAKWSPVTGNFVWAKQTTNASSSGYASAQAIAVVGNSVYVAGSFAGGPAFFDGLALSNVGMSNYEELFVTKLVDAGSTASFAWAKAVGGTRTEVVTGLAVGESAVYVTGHSDSPVVDFGSTTLTNAGNANVNGFVAKLLDDGLTGTFGWVQAIVGPSTNDVTAVAVEADQVYIAGFFYGTSTLGTATITSAGGTDMFVAKLIDQGATASVVWARPLGGAANDVGAGLAVQNSVVYVAGAFNGTTTSFGSTTLTSAGGADACLIKLTDAGTTSSVGWVQKLGGTLGDTGKRVAAQGNAVYLLGQFGIGPSNTAIATATVGSTTIASVGGGDVFLAKFTDAGSTSSVAWVQQAGSQDQEEAGGLSLNGNKVYVSGTFNASVLLLAPLVLTKAYNNEVGSAFLASLTDVTLPTRASAAALAGLRLWPNPAQATATVLVPTGPGQWPATLTLLDAVGRAVRVQSATPGLAAELDLVGLAPGVYALRVQAGAAVAVRQLVVE